MALQPELTGEGGKFINLPPPARVIQMETENYERILKEEKAKGRKKTDLNIMFMEVVARKDLYRVATGVGYEPPIEVTRSQKNSLIKVFYALQGFAWKRNFGWVGQDRSLSKPEVRMFEAEASLFDGVTVGRVLNLTSKGSTGTINKLDLAGK